MEKNLHNIDQLFKNGLEAHQEELSSQTWDTISHKLDLNEKANLEKDNKRLRRVIFWLSAACITGFIIVASTWNGTNNKNTDQAKSNEKIGPIESPAIAKDQQRKNEISGKESLQETENSAAKGEAPIVNATHEAKDQKDNSPVPFPIKNRKITSGDSRKDENRSGEKGLNDQLATSKSNDKSTNKNLIEKQVVKNQNSSRLIQLNKDAAVQQNTDAASISKKKRSNKDLPMIKEEAVTAGKDYSSLKLKSINLLSREAVQASLAGNKLELNTAATPIKLKFSKRGNWDLAVQYGQTSIKERVEDGWKEHREDDKDEIKRTQANPKSWNVLATVSYKLKSGIFFSSGLGYSEQTRNIQPKPLFARRPRMGQPPPPGSSDEYKYKFNCTAGYALIDPKTATPVSNGDSIISFASTSTLNYITIPVGVGYEFKIGKMQLFAQSMVQANILAKTNLETNLEFSSGSIQKKDVDIMGLKKVYFSGILGAGVAYELAPKTSVYFMPQAGFSLGTITKDAPTSTYTSGFSWQTGIKFSL